MLAFLLGLLGLLGLLALWLPGCCVARCRKKRNRGSKHVEKTLPRTFQNEAPGGQKWKPKWFNKWLQNGCLQNGSLEASGRPLGALGFLSDFGCHLGSHFGSQNRPWNAPRAKRRPMLPSWRVPGRVPEGRWEVIVGTFFAVELAGTKKKARKVPINTAFVACVFLPLPCVFCAPRRSPAQKHN